jgi:ADP-ribose pyrophosphatase
MKHPTPTIKVAYRGKTIELRILTFGTTKTYDVIHHPGATVIIPIDSKGRLIMIRQWRPAIQRIILELPAGTLETGESPLACAKREIREETGFAAGTIKGLGSFYSCPGFCDEILHLFVATELTKSPLPKDEDEEIKVVSIPLIQTLRLIEKGEIIDAKSIVGILRYALLKKK